MRYRPFGRTGLQVSVVGFGCWPMAGDRYGAIEDDEAVKAIHRALDRGVNCVDTAPAYGAGHSEEVVARALETRRRDVILVTKCGVKAPPPGQLGPVRDSSRANIVRELDESLRRLRTDWVDVLLVHWPDAGTPFEETMRALDEVVTSGRVRFVGVSNFTGAMIEACMRVRRIDVIQVGYHMFDRRQEHETFPACVQHGIGVMGYGSLGHGLLTGAFTAALGGAHVTSDLREARLFRGDVDVVTLEAAVELKPREAEELGGAPLVTVRPLECVDDGLALEFPQGGGFDALPRGFGLPRRSGILGRYGNGKVGGGDETPLTGDEAPLDGVLQFADVSRPSVPPQQLTGVPTERDISLGHPGRECPDESLGEEQHVVPSFPEGRQVHVENAQPIEEDGAEPPGGHLRVQILVRRRDQTDVGFERRRAADSLELTFLEHT